MSTLQYVKWGTNDPEVASCSDPFARTKSQIAEELMREDQAFMGEHGIDALIVLQHVRAQTTQRCIDELMFGASYEDSDGNRVDPAEIRWLNASVDPGPLDHFFTGPDAARCLTPSRL